MVEFVGFDEIWNKINNLDKIQSISLPDCRICDLGPKGHLNNLLRNNNNEIQSYKTKINNLEQTFNEYKNIEIKVKDFEHKIIMLTQEI